MIYRILLALSLFFVLLSFNLTLEGKEIGLTSIYINKETKKISIPSSVSIIHSFITKRQERLDPGVALIIARAVYRASEDTGLPVGLILGVIEVESFPAYNHMSLSKQGAMGLMQLCPSTWSKEMKSKYSLPNYYNIYDNVLVGSRLISDLYSQYNDMDRVIEIYMGNRNEKALRKIYRTFMEYQIHERKERAKWRNNKTKKSQKE